MHSRNAPIDKIVGIGRAVVSIGLTAVLLTCGGDRHESFYPSLADAAKDGAITRGWIPDDLLPRGAHGIREVHDLSPSREWCSFEFSPSEWLNPGNDFQPVDALPPPLSHVPSPGVSWWPAVLRGDLDLTKVHREGLKLYVVKRPETSVTTEVLLFAIDSVRGRGFFYSSPG
jgi:hypothetical protein